MYSAMTRKAKIKAKEVFKITANFPKDLWKDLKRRALEDEETVTDILVRLCERYIGAKRRKRKEKNG
jgi:hypothetical protein